MRKAIFIILLLPALSFSQGEKKPDSWEPLRFFVGSWEGTGKGKPGNSKIERDYQFLLNGKFLQVRNKSTYPSQKENPKGEIHEDLGFFSYDRSRKVFVLRQFHIEGFVNQYVMETPTSELKTLTFVSEAIENIPAGWRARETYKILDQDHFIEIFELAPPGKQFELYSEGHFKRKR